MKFLGTWDTDFGLMSLFNPSWSSGLDGFYYDPETCEMEGMIRDSYGDKMLSGYWIQSISLKKCSYKKHGTYYWGKIKFVMNENSFAGTWGYCWGLLDQDRNGVLGRAKRMLACALASQQKTSGVRLLAKVGVCPLVRRYQQPHD